MFQALKKLFFNFVEFFFLKKMGGHGGTFRKKIRWGESPPPSPPFFGPREDPANIGYQLVIV